MNNSKKEKGQRFMDKLKKKRTIIIMVCFGLLILICLLIFVGTSTEVEIVDERFGCGCSGDVMSLLFAEQTGIKFEGELIEGEWYPFLFGFEMIAPNCMSPVVCGVSLFAGSLVSSEGYKSYHPHSSEGTDVIIIDSNVEEGVDYKIKEIFYTLEDRKGNTRTNTDFNNLLNEDGLWGDIRIEALSLAGINKYEFSLGIIIDIEVFNDCNLDIEFAIKEKMPIHDIQYTVSEKTSGYYEKGTHSIEVIIKNIDYLKSRYDLSVSKKEITGTKKYFIKG